MFTRVKEFNKRELVPRLKKFVEQSSSLARVICNYEETGPSWQEFWQDEG